MSHIYYILLVVYNKYILFKEVDYLKIVKSYKNKIISLDKSTRSALRNTLSIYRSVVSYIINVVNDNYEAISSFNGVFKKTHIENLIHTTKNNSASYDFDLKFKKFPSYLRRSAIADALGIVDSYKSNLENYNTKLSEATAHGKTFKKKPPKLTFKHFKCPAFYKNNMFLDIDGFNIKLKLFFNNDWIWFNIKLRNQDVKYIKKNCKDLKVFSPVLKKSDRYFYLVYSFEDEVILSKTPLKDQKVLGIDLGLNNTAVCSVINYEGTVLDRLFINQKREKDLQNHLINRLKRKQKLNKRAENKSLWSKLNGLNDYILNDTVSRIIKFAEKHKVDVIIFEYLDFKKGLKNSRNNISAKFHFWAKRDIVNKTIAKAHTYGIRVNRVCAKNTSVLAYDGSGKVKRNDDNYSLCQFATGKQYNCDLNASYNIGARYFIKEIYKTSSERKWLEILAKVPILSTRTNSTLSTLINLVAVI